MTRSTMFRFCQIHICASTCDDSLLLLKWLCIEWLTIPHKTKKLLFTLSQNPWLFAAMNKRRCIHFSIYSISLLHFGCTATSRTREEKCPHMHAHTHKERDKAAAHTEVVETSVPVLRSQICRRKSWERDKRITLFRPIGHIKVEICRCST